MRNRAFNQLALYAFVVFITLMEAAFTHAGALRNLPQAASALGVSQGLLRTRSLTLAALDLAAGAGALLAVLSLARFLKAVWLRRGRAVCIAALAAYAGYQFWMLITQWPPSARLEAAVSAVLYLSLGGLAWRLGG